MKINGTTFSKPQQVCVQPTAPLKTGKDFDSWYLDPVDDSNEFSFLGTPINAPLVLYAHWV